MEAVRGVYLYFNRGERLYFCAAHHCLLKGITLALPATIVPEAEWEGKCKKDPEQK
jgi:hypothetical protein